MDDLQRSKNRCFRTWVWLSSVFAFSLIPTALCITIGDDSNTNVIKIGAILPYHGTHDWLKSKIAPAIEYAVESVANKTDLLNGYKFTITYGDSECSDTTGPLTAIDMYFNKAAYVFLGPVCDYSVAPIARFSPHWNVPLITPGARVYAFKNKTIYSQLTRIIGDHGKLGEFMQELFIKFNWSHASMIYHRYMGKSDKGEPDCLFVMEGIFLAMKETFEREHPGKELWRESFDEENLESYNLTKILQEASKNARSKFMHSFHTHQIYLMLVINNLNLFSISLKYFIIPCLFA